LKQLRYLYLKIFDKLVENVILGPVKYRYFMKLFGNDSRNEGDNAVPTLETVGFLII